MSESDSDAPVQFEAVGGHKSSIFYGDRTRDGRSTLQKKTTAWEIMYYFGMELSKDASVAKAAPKEDDALRAKFIDAVGKLGAFAPQLFSFRFPEKFVPKTAELQPYVSEDGEWLVVEEGAPARAIIAPLFKELFDGAEGLTDFDAAYDTAIWGIGLVDETSGMQRPCVMDVKMGFIRHAPTTPADKVERMMKKEVNSLMRTTALRVCGCQHYLQSGPAAEGDDADKKKAGVCEKYGKEIGFAVADVAEQSLCLKLFLSSNTPIAHKAADGKELTFHAEALSEMSESDKADTAARIAEIRADVKELLHFLEDTPQGVFLLQNLAFVSASVLLLYDAAAAPSTTRLRFIDFARSNWRRLNFDEPTVGFVQGLKNLDAYLS